MASEEMHPTSLIIPKEVVELGTSKAETGTIQLTPLNKLKFKTATGSQTITSA